MAVEMPLIRALQITTREEAAQADRQTEWAKTPRQQPADMEFLRAQRYPGGRAPRLDRRTVRVVYPFLVSEEQP